MEEEKEESIQALQPIKACKDESGLLSGPVWGRPNSSYHACTSHEIKAGITRSGARLCCMATSQAGRSRDAKLAPLMDKAAVKHAQSTPKPFAESKHVHLQLQPLCSEAPPTMGMINSMSFHQLTSHQAKHFRWEDILVILLHAGCLQASLQT